MAKKNRVPSASVILKSLRLDSAAVEIVFSVNGETEDGGIHFLHLLPLFALLALAARGHGEIVVVLRICDRRRGRRRKEERRSGMIYTLSLDGKPIPTFHGNSMTF